MKASPRRTQPQVDLEKLKSQFRAFSEQTANQQLIDYFLMVGPSNEAVSHPILHLRYDPDFLAN